MPSTENSNEFVADTYALIELCNGNPEYQQYTKKTLLTTKFHLAELYYYFLREHTKEIANTYCARATSMLVPVSFLTIARAMQFRYSHRKERLSYADCIGYALAQELDVPFLTGDTKFQARKGVMFVR